MPRSNTGFEPFYRIVTKFYTNFQRPTMHARIGRTADASKWHFRSFALARRWQSLHNGSRRLPGREADGGSVVGCLLAGSYRLLVEFAGVGEADAAQHAMGPRQRSGSDHQG